MQTCLEGWQGREPLDCLAARRESGRGVHGPKERALIAVADWRVLGLPGSDRGQESPKRPAAGLDSRSYPKSTEFGFKRLSQM